MDVFAGLKKDGYILINTNRSFDDLGLGEFVRDWSPERLCTVAATDLALKHLGRPVPNVPLLGGFAAISDVIRLESVVKALEAGDLSLEQSLALYERGVQLSRFCHARLDEAERRIDLLTERGELKLAPASLSSDDSERS